MSQSQKTYDFHQFPSASCHFLPRAKTHAVSQGGICRRVLQRGEAIQAIPGVSKSNFRFSPGEPLMQYMMNVYDMIYSHFCCTLKIKVHQCLGQVVFDFFFPSIWTASPTYFRYMRLEAGTSRLVLAIKHIIFLLCSPNLLLMPSILDDQAPSFVG